MYLDYFGLTTKPFQITTDPMFLWLGEKHKEALATLRYGIQDNRGFLLLTGEVGTGKTILVNRLISLLDTDTIVATLPDPDLERMDFYRLLADGLKMDAAFNSKGEFLIQFRKFLLQSHANHKQVLLIIDESQRLTNRLMEDIRVLSNFELQDRKLINIFFVGQPEFNAKLMTVENRALSQRITVRYNIEALDQQEASDYVNYRLRVAGSLKPIFKITALNEIFHFSRGIPRLINIISDHALLTAFSRNLKQVDADTVRECAEELRIPEQQARFDVATLKTRADPVPNNDSKESPDGTESKTGNQQMSNITSEGRGEKPDHITPVVWKMSYLVVILLLLAILGVVIRQYVAGPEFRFGDANVSAQKPGPDTAATRPTNSDQTTRKQPVESVKPPTPSNFAHEAGAVRTAPVDKEIEKTDHAAVTTEAIPTMTENQATVRGGDSPYDPPAGDPGAGSMPKISAAPPEEDQIKPLPLMKQKVVIPFDINSNDIGGEAYAALDRIGLFLSAHPGQKIIVRGYTDSSGSAGYNETVSNFRANAVKSYLIGKGVKAEDITIYAMGAFNPVASNDTTAGRRKNRRVEIEFVENQISNN